MPFFSAASLAPAVVSSALDLYGNKQVNKSNEKISGRTTEFNRVQAQLNRRFQTASNAKQMAFQKDSVTRQMKYQTNSIAGQHAFQRQSILDKQKYDTMMANTSWQRGVKDMKAAGINPIYAFAKGGASTPQSTAASGASGGGSNASGSTSGGSTASGQNYQAVNETAGLVSSAISARRAVAEIKSIEAQTDFTKSKTAIASPAAAAGEVLGETANSASALWRRYIGSKADFFRGADAIANSVSSSAKEVRSIIKQYGKMLSNRFSGSANKRKHMEISIP